MYDDNIEVYLSVEENGGQGAKRKATTLMEAGYAILAIEHTMVPMAGSTSTPYSSTWGKTEKGYRIVVDRRGYPDGMLPSLPEIEELL